MTSPFDGRMRPVRCEIAAERRYRVAWDEVPGIEFNHWDKPRSGDIGARVMASTFTNLLFHFIFSTKYRKPLLDDSIRDELYRYISGILREQKGSLLEIGGMPDHVHILAKLSPTIAIADVLKLVKASSSKWVNERGSRWQRFQWQTGYAAFSVSESQSDAIRKYIQGQEEHHRKKTFREEYIEFLKKHRIEYDDRYVFEEEHIG